MLESVTTVKEVIDVLGGPTAVARMTGRKPQHVVNWRATGRFPATTFLSLSKALQGYGKTAPTELWGMEHLVEIEPAAQG